MPKSEKSLLFTLYTTDWCGDCFRLKHHLAKLGLKAGQHFQEINIDQNPEAANIVESINDGYRSVPTLVFKDNSSLTEPSLSELDQKLQKLLK
jgi:mycoredoxin